MDVCLRHCNQSPIIPIEASRRAKTEKSTSSPGKCEGFTHCFLQLKWYGASIRNTTLKLCVDCAKQFVRNAQNYGKTNNGFSIMITLQLTHRCLCVSFGQKQNCNQVAAVDFFLIPKLKTPMKGNRFATMEEIREKSKQELSAIPKSAYRNVSRIGKNASISVLYLRGVTLKATR